MYRGRFAPTPSGELHMGSLVTAVASFLDARAAGGQWLLRVEDIDTQRSREQFESSIKFELERHGFTWDELVVRQSERQDYYSEALSALNSAGVIYPCRCTRSSLQQRCCRVNAEGEFVYPQICRPEEPRSFQRSDFFAAGVSVRFKAEDEATIFEDRWQGSQQVRVMDDVGDFVLRRNDGCFSYHLAVVVDDYLQGITDVVRGVDILPLTARHILLQRAFGFSTPRYLHIPLVYGADGRKLSKSDSAQAVKSGDAQSNLLAALGHLRIQIDRQDATTCEQILTLAVEQWNKKSNNLF